MVREKLLFVCDEQCTVASSDGVLEVWLVSTTVAVLEVRRTVRALEIDHAFASLLGITQIVPCLKLM